MEIKRAGVRRTRVPHFFPIIFYGNISKLVEPADPEEAIAVSAQSMYQDATKAGPGPSVQSREGEHDAGGT